MEYLLLCLSIIFGASKSVLSKCVNPNGSFSKTLKTNVILFFCAFCFMGGFVLFSVSEWRVPWLLSSVYALCMVFAQISLMKAVECGSVAISSLFYSCGFIIPTVWGCIYFQEGINALQVIGVILILGSFLLNVEKKDGERFKVKWLFAALGGTLFSGLLGMIQKLFAVQETAYSLDLFLFVAFAMTTCLSGVLFGIVCAVEMKKTVGGSTERTEKDKTGKARAWIFTVFLGIVMGGVNKLNTYLAGILPSIIVFPAINGGGIVLTAALSGIVFKEKLERKRIFSIVLGIVAIIMIAIGQNI